MSIMQNTQKDLAAIIGGYISELRKDAGLTQQQLADELHIGKGSISHFEQGRATPPTNLLVLSSRRIVVLHYSAFWGIVAGHCTLKAL